MAPLGWVALAFIVGVLVGPVGGAWVDAVGTVTLAVLAARYGGRTIVATLAVLAAGVCAGMCCASALPRAVPRERAVEWAGLLRGEVIRGCVADGDSTVCLIERDDRSRVQLRVDACACDAGPGERIEAIATITPVEPDVNGARWGPGGSLARRGIAFTARASRCARVAGRIDPWEWPRRVGWRVRLALRSGLERALTEPARSQSEALLFGDESALERGDVEAFRQSGLAHLLAVSGAHVALVAAVLSALSLAFVRRVPALALSGHMSVVGALLPLPAVGVFVLATGESPSAVRAFVAATLGAASRATGRTVHGEALVAASALITAGADPSNVLDPGWQLSIVASWALAASYREPNGEPKPRLVESLFAAWREVLATSARVAVAAAPLLTWQFQRVPATAVVANALAAPVAESLALPCVVIDGFAGIVVPTLAHSARTVVAPLLDAIFAMPRVALRLPFATASPPVPTPTQVVVLTATALIAMRFRARGRLVALAVAIAIVGGLEIAHRAACHPHAVLRLTVLDVGQGDALLVELPDGAAMLVDAGGARRMGSDPGARVVLPYLADRRRRSLAVVVASHPHPDHIGGLPAILDSTQVGELWDTRQGESWRGTAGAFTQLRAAAARNGVAIRGPESLCGPAHAFHGAVLHVIAPCPAVRPFSTPNDASFVIRIDFGHASILLPGDLERGGEADVLSRLQPVTVLKVPHHGSRSSSTDAWLDRLRPRFAIASMGHPSPFGHPHPEVVERYRAHGIPLWTTAEHGAVRVTLRADGAMETEPAP